MFGWSPSLRSHVSRRLALTMLSAWIALTLVQFSPLITDTLTRLHLSRAAALSEWRPLQPDVQGVRQ